MSVDWGGGVVYFTNAFFYGRIVTHGNGTMKNVRSTEKRSFC